MKTVVFGASGVVGRAVAEHLAPAVVAVSRRSPGLPDVVHVPVDLTDEAAAAEAVGSAAFAGVTHVVFAALQEGPELAKGWRDPELMATNEAMFRNALEPLLATHGRSLEHVTLLQGAKAYGFHTGSAPLPAKERLARDQHDNFYFRQEDALRALADGGPWSWTILRPQVVYGESIGSPMNLLPAIGVYAAVERAAGRPMTFPGGAPVLQEGVDARLLARAIAWAGRADAAREQTFNVTNGDVFDWVELWPIIADSLDVEPGPTETQQLARTMPPRAEEWAAIVDRRSLRAPRDMDSFVGASWAYADILFGSLGSARSRPALLSTVTIRRAGFGDCIDSEDMFREWFARFRERRLLP